MKSVQRINGIGVFYVFPYIYSMGLEQGLTKNDKWFGLSPFPVIVANEGLLVVIFTGKGDNPINGAKSMHVMDGKSDKTVDSSNYVSISCCSTVTYDIRFACSTIMSIVICSLKELPKVNVIHTVDGRNPAPPGMYKTL